MEPTIAKWTTKVVGFASLHPPYYCLRQRRNKMISEQYLALMTFDAYNVKRASIDEAFL